MKDPVLVRSSMRTWDFTLLFLAGVAILAGAGVLASKGQTAGAVLVAAVGGACVLGTVLGRWYRVRRRRWVQDLGDGFRVIDNTGEREVRDDEVLSMALSLRQNYVNGVLKSETRRFLVWLATDDPPPERLELTNTIKTGNADPLADLINRIGNRLFEFAKEDLAAGRSVLGEHWSLQDGELTVRGKGQAVACPVAEVSAVDSVDNHICVWRTGEDATFARVPVESANAHLLWRLLGEQLAQRPASSAPPAEGSLGRIIFERKPSTGQVVAFALVAVILLVATVVLALTSKWETRAWALACAAGAVACAVGAVHSRWAVFRCHEYGVFKAGLMGASRLQYADVEAFSYSAVRHFHNGVYTGTIFNLKFEPTPEHKADRIQYNVNLRNADQQLETLRDQVSRMIASRMAQQLAKKVPVRWTARLQFLPDGIEFQPGGLFGKKVPVVVRFPEVYTYRIDQGTFYLWTRDQKKPVIQEAMTQPNFFPGFFLLTMIVPLSVQGSGGAG
jgi:hypothetical protein